MRSAEIRSLRWSAANLDGSLLTVGRAKSRAGTGRQIPINPDLVKVLDEHARWYVRKLGEIKPEWYVFPGRKGKPVRGQQRPLDPTMPISDITSAWDALRKRAGVQCRFHDLRHTVATKMAEADVAESTMLALMGHMSRAMLEKYSHIRMAAKRAAVKALEMPKVGPRLVSSTPMTNRRQSKPRIRTAEAGNA
jgi:integrase